jgi:hypothetical protein
MFEPVPVPVDTIPIRVQVRVTHEMLRVTSEPTVLQGCCKTVRVHAYYITLGSQSRLLAHFSYLFPLGSKVVIGDMNAAGEEAVANGITLAN